MFLAFLAAVLVGFTQRASAAAATQTSLTVSTDDSSSRTTVTLTARVATASGMEIPGGVVNFRTSNLDLGSAVVASDGTATLTTNNLPAGSHHVIAVFQGNDAYAQSISASSQVQASTPVTGFTVGASPTAVSIQAGAFATSIVTVTPVNGFNAYVSLSCSNLPVAATCTFSPVNVLASCSGTTCTPGLSTMQIQTLAPSGTLTPTGAAARSRGSSSPAMPLYAFALPAFLAFAGGFAGLRRRKHRAFWNVLLVASLLAGAMTLTACNVRWNYLNHGPTYNPGTPAGTYGVTIDSVSTTGSLITTPPTSPQLALTITPAPNSPVK
ncbi:MAG TPA: Ig-like domain-containing protein [Acidobacteriaceae bacterium]|nr:Ig-like domain-containing protein [Acidobacteriaceae bacterium]